MMDLDLNLANSPYQYARERSLLAMIIYKYSSNTVSYGMQTSDDEDNDQNLETPTVPEDWEREAIVVQEPPKRRVVFRESYSEEPRTKKVKVNESPEVNQSEIGHHLTMVKAYDTHFHLDRMSRLIYGDNSLTVSSVVTQQLERPPLIPVNLEGGVLVYCDPETYPVNMPIDTKWKVAVGIHPKQVVKCSEKQIKMFFDLIKNPRVSAVGEVGLDTSLRDGTRKKQEEFLEQVLDLVKPTIPIILHIRSTRPDKYSKGLYHRALDILKIHCHPTQNIILHCFTGDDSVRKEWSDHFPNVFFSFSSIVKKFDQEQLKAIKNISVTRLLVETDSPYMPPSDIRINSPIYIGETIQSLAMWRSTSTAEMGRVTTLNAMTLMAN